MYNSYPSSQSHHLSTVSLSIINVSMSFILFVTIVTKLKWTVIIIGWVMIIGVIYLKLGVALFFSCVNDIIERYWLLFVIKIETLCCLGKINYYCFMVKRFL